MHILEVQYPVSLSELIAAGRYDFIHADITEKNFPIAGEGKETVEIFLIRFNCKMESPELFRELDEMHLIPARVEHLLFLGKGIRSLNEYSIVALGSTWTDGRGRAFSPCMYRWLQSRYLDLESFHSVFDGTMTFATLLRKEE